MCGHTNSHQIHLAKRKKISLHTRYNIYTTKHSLIHDAVESIEQHQAL